MNLVLDTGIIIAVVLGEPSLGPAAARLLSYISAGTHQAAFSVMSVAEFTAILTKRGYGRKVAESLLSLRDAGVTICPIDEQTARVAGHLKAKYATAKKGFSYGDAMILSTALRSRADAVVTVDEEFSTVTEIPIRRPEDL